MLKVKNLTHLSKKNEKRRFQGASVIINRVMVIFSP